MPIVFPSLLRLGGESQFGRYQAEFDALYHERRIVDPKGRRVSFPPDACRHVCFKDQKEDRYRRLPRVWDQDRAERIPWIEAALTTPQEIRWSHQDPENQGYLLLIRREPDTGGAWERYGAYVEPLSAEEVRFITAYPMQQWYWDNARWLNLPPGTVIRPRIWPEPKTKKRRR